MKKLSIEEKAKAYDEAVERLRNAFYDNNSRMCEEYRNAVLKIIEPIFPELAESEDERIRKWLIKEMGRRLSCWTSTEVTKEQVLAWLEKQGDKISAIEGFETEFERQVSHLIASAINREHEYNEGYVKWTANALLNYAKHELEKQGDLLFQKMKDAGYEWDYTKKELKKNEPKFRVGDWIIHKDNKHIPIKIIEKIGMYYRTVDTVNYYQNIYISYINENYRLWTIKDAKAGDVLACNEEILLFKSYSVQGRISLYCWYNGQTNNFHSKEVVDTLMTTRNKIYPATKEQRDTLMKAMADAGYEWDFEKKELKKIEQKSVVDTKVVIPKFRVGDIVKSKSQPMLSPRKIISIGKDCYWCEDRGCIGFAWEDDCEIVEQKPTDKVEPKWKPTDKDIFELQCVINNDPYNGFILKALLEQLKKLREE